MDNADLIEKYEVQLWETVYNMGRDGISFEVTQYIVEEMAKSLKLMAAAEPCLIDLMPDGPESNRTVEMA